MDNYFDLYFDDAFTSENENDDGSQLCEPTNYILSIEDYKELMNSEQPGVLEWKDSPTNYEEASNINVDFTFDEATRSAWKSAQDEITSILINSRKEDLLNLSEIEKPSTENIFSLFFGEESRFAKVLMLHLHCDYQTLTSWLQDICMQAIYQLSPTDLYQDTLVGYADITFIWKPLSQANQSSNNIICMGCRGDFLYKELQFEFNKIS